jgi:ElaB/YqjD/DUF883 family membrane-anchored ribosome-binding protein
MPLSFRLGRPFSAPAGTFPLASGWGHSEDFPSNVEYVMSNTSGTRDTVRDAARDARDAAREAGKAASAASDDIQADLEALRNDVAHLASQFADIVATRGSAAWSRAKSNIQASLEGAMSEAGAKGQEAVDAVREVGDNMIDAVDRSLKQRPYTTLALAVAIGFLFGATWRR